jgi:hypothetical protein
MPRYALRLRLPAGIMKAFTVRIAEPEYEALQALYYATIKDHRSSFNAWICKLIAEGMTRAWYEADCPQTRPTH